ncbi:MAG: hypothetical protein ABEK50_12905 [bacterium]
MITSFVLLNLMSHGDVLQFNDDILAVYDWIQGESFCCIGRRSA